MAVGASEASVTLIIIMTNYYLFPNRLSTGFGILIIFFLAIPLFTISSTLHAQTIVNTPCSCTAWNTVGATNTETDLSVYITNFGPFSSSKCYLIKGTLVIDQPTEWVNLRFKMEEKSKIRVEDNLSMTNSYLSGCGDMWQGIHTVGQTYLHTYSSFIEDAEYGIKLSGLAGLVCIGTHFINDFIGIATASPFTTDTEDKVIHRGEIRGCHFYTSTTLPDPYPGQDYDNWPTTPAEIPYNQGFAAIYLSRTVGLNIGYADAEDPDRNKIHDMRNGIILRDKTVADISGTDYYNFEGGIARSLPDPLLDLNQHAIDMNHSVSIIRDNTMDNLMVGIFGMESANTMYRNEISLSTPSPGFGFTRGITLIRPQKAEIIQNIINEGMRGISIEDVVNDFLVQSNELTTTFYFVGISPRIIVRNAKLDMAEGVIEDNDLSIDDATASTGIHLLNVNNILVDNNDITFNNEEDRQTRGILGVGLFNSTIRHNEIFRSLVDVLSGNNGIQLENSAFNTVFCNTIENFWIDMNLVASNPKTYVLSNILNEGEYGFGLWGPSMIGTQYHHGNKWPVTYSNYGAFLFSGGIQEAEVSRFFVDEMENGDFMPYPIGPVDVEEGVWFIDEYTVTPTFTCFSNPSPIANPDTLSKLIRMELSYDQFNDEMTWTVKADIFDMILADPGLTSNAVLDSFYNAEENTALGKLIAWQHDLSSRFGEERGLKGLTLDTITTLSDDIVYIDSILALSPNDSATWIAHRALKGDTLEIEIAELRSYLEDEEDDSKIAFLDMADDIDNLTTTNDLEAYLREALLFKAQYLLGNTFTSGDSSDLATLALLCPWEGGRAMSTGQELYSTINNQLMFTTLDNCPSAPSRSVMTSTDQYQLNDKTLEVHPNPVADHVNILCADQMLKISMWNTDLKTVYEGTPMDQQWTIPMNNMPAGIYILSATTASGQYYKQILHIK